MKEFISVVASEVGLHARPASLFVNAAKASGCKVQLTKVVDGTPGAYVDGASILKVMALGIKCGESVSVQIEGENEAAAVDSLKAIIESADH
ncbi:MAG: hypothetical protein RL448_364 [Actinomycetota bacterium]